MDENAITISKFIDNEFKINISRGISVNELSIYTSRLAYYLAVRWSELNNISLNDATESVLTVIQSNISDWNKKETSENN